MGELNGLMIVKSNTELLREEREEARRRQELVEADPVVSTLSAHVRRAWERNRQAKEPMQKRLLSCLRRRNGEYAPDILAGIQSEGGAAIWMMITDEKCNAFAAWLEDIVLPANDKAWTIKATPVPDLGPAEADVIQATVRAEVVALLEQGLPVTREDVTDRVRQLMKKLREIGEIRARETVKRQEKMVEDKLVEGGYERAVKELIDDFATYPFCVLKGPIFRTKKKLTWGRGEDGEPMPVIDDVIVQEVERVSPFDVYPAPGARSPDDGDFIERHQLSRKDLIALRGVDGYSTAAIDMVLDDYGRGLRDWLAGDAERKQQESGAARLDLDDEKIEALQFWGSVQGKVLIDGGADPDRFPDPLAEYEAEVWLIGSHVIKAVLNDDPRGLRPYYVTGFRKRPGQFAGVALPEVIADTQDMCNSTARSMANNMALASGPQIGVDIASMPEGEDITNVTPWRIWQFDGRQRMNGSPPIWFFQPASFVQELMAVYSKFSDEADNKSGIPKYAYGQGQNLGSLSTATGFSQMMQNATRGVKKAVSAIDVDVIEPMAQRFWETMMRYEGTGGEVTDIQIVARGSAHLLAKEQHLIRKNELLQVALGNPQINQLLGPRVLLLLKQIMDAHSVDTDAVLPPEGDIMKMIAAHEAMLKGGVGMPQPDQGAPPPGMMPQENLAGDAMGGVDFTQFRGRAG